MRMRRLNHPPDTRAGAFAVGERATACLAPGIGLAPGRPWPEAVALLFSFTDHDPDRPRDTIPQRRADLDFVHRVTMTPTNGGRRAADRRCHSFARKSRA